MAVPRILDTALNIWENNDIFRFQFIRKFLLQPKDNNIYLYLIVFLFKWIRNFEEMKISKLH